MVCRMASKSDSYMVSSEGKRIVTTDAIFRIMIEAETRADDGMQLMRVKTYQFTDPAKFPSEAEVAHDVEKMPKDLSALRAAPLAEPYTAPPFLSARPPPAFFPPLLRPRCAT